MPYPLPFTIQPPGNWQDFEEVCASYFSFLWNDTSVERFGRSGQKQYGIDILSRDGVAGSQAAQCKLDESRLQTILSREDIDGIVRIVETFPHPLTNLTTAVTHARDAPLQSYVNSLSAKRRRNGKFTVDILFWETLVRSAILRYPNVIEAHYPYHTIAALRGQLAAIQSNYASISQKLDRVIDLLKRSGAKPSGRELAFGNIPAVNESARPSSITRVHFAVDDCPSLEAQQLYTFVHKLPAGLAYDVIEAGCPRYANSPLEELLQSKLCFIQGTRLTANPFYVMNSSADLSANDKANLLQHLIFRVRSLGASPDKDDPYSAAHIELDDIRNTPVVIIEALKLYQEHAHGISPRMKRMLLLLHPVLLDMMKRVPNRVRNLISLQDSHTFCTEAHRFLLMIRHSLSSRSFAFTSACLLYEQSENYFRLRAYDEALDADKKAIDTLVPLTIGQNIDVEINGFLVEVSIRFASHLRRLGAHESALEVYGKALGGCQLALGAGVRLPPVLMTTCIVHSHFSEIHLRGGDEKKATYHCRLGLQQSYRLFKYALLRTNFGTEDDRRYVQQVDADDRLCVALSRLTDVRVAQRQAPKARIAAMRCSQITLRILSEQPLNRYMARNLSSTYCRLSFVCRKEGLGEESNRYKALAKESFMLSTGYVDDAGQYLTFASDSEDDMMNLWDVFH